MSGRANAGSRTFGSPPALPSPFLLNADQNVYGAGHPYLLHHYDDCIKEEGGMSAQPFYSLYFTLLLSLTQQVTCYSLPVSLTKQTSIVARVWWNSDSESEIR